MKVTYEFNLDLEDTNDYYGLQLVRLAPKMYRALENISDYLRGYRKGWNEDDAEKMEEIISDMICDSNIGEIE